MRLSHETREWSNIFWRPFNIREREGSLRSYIYLSIYRSIHPLIHVEVPHSIFSWGIMHDGIHQWHVLGSVSGSGCVWLLVAHFFQHPLRQEPFVELMKSSLQTFLNVTRFEPPPPMGGGEERTGRIASGFWVSHDDSCSMPALRP